MKKGFTLIELVIVLVLFSILAGFILWVFSAGLKAWNFDMDRSNLRESGNLAIETMARELSQAHSIRSAAAAEITFWADAAGAEEVTFSAVSGELIRTDNAGARVLAHNVQTLGLLYRDTDDNPMAVPRSVRKQSGRDNIRVVIMSVTLNDGDETIRLSSSVYLRNQRLEQI
jgi:prepilin-type N-terminal cleavage/methylation domain-containing protein